MDAAEIQRIKDFIKQVVIDEFTAQGHSLTGAFEAALEVVVEENQDKLIFICSGKHYGKYLNEGVKKESISFKMFPFVLNYVKLRMKLDEIKAKGVAAAIINKWKAFGMPTAKSYSYSKNGDRRNFIPRSIATIMQDGTSIMTNIAANSLNANIKKMVNTLNQLTKD